MFIRKVADFLEVKEGDSNVVSTLKPVVEGWLIGAAIIGTVYSISGYASLMKN